MSTKTSTGIKAAFISIAALGAVTLIISTYAFSSFYAILGLSLLFWGAILLYITPSKNNFTGILLSSVRPYSVNIERTLSKYPLDSQGIYFVVENEASNSASESPNSVLVYIQKAQNISMEQNSWSIKDKTSGTLILPPGQTLGELLEKRIGKSFTSLDANQFGKKLGAILTRELKLADTFTVEDEGNLVKIEIVKSFFEPICQETKNQPRTHKLVGCLLTSALACVYAKKKGKPIAIKSETFDVEARKTIIQFIILDIKDFNCYADFVTAS